MKGTVSGLLYDHLLCTLTCKVFSALAVAMTIIDEGTRGANGNLLRYKREIIIVTDGQGFMETSDLDAIAERLKEIDTSITLLYASSTLHRDRADLNSGVEFDDPESGFKEENKDSVKVRFSI